jgi:hypothetical protein
MAAPRETRRGREAYMAISVTGENEDHRSQLDSRLHEVAWGLLLMLTGIMWLVPSAKIPEGAWLLGVATILLGANVVRYVSSIPLNGFSVALGLMALLAAVSRFWGTELPLLAVCIIIIGFSLAAKPLFMRSSQEDRTRLPQRR